MTQRKISSPAASPPIARPRLKGGGASDCTEVKQKESFDINQEFIAFFMTTISFSRAGGGEASHQMDGQLKVSPEIKGDSADCRLPPTSFLRLERDGGAQQHGGKAEEFA